MDRILTTAPRVYQTTDSFRTQYQSAISLHMYAMLGTRPNLAFSVSVTSQYTFNLNPNHW